MNDDEQPILSDFTPFNPFTPSLWTPPAYRQLLVTFVIVTGITGVVFAVVHFWR